MKPAYLLIRDLLESIPSAKEIIFDGRISVEIENNNNGYDMGRNGSFFSLSLSFNISNDLIFDVDASRRYGHWTIDFNAVKDNIFFSLPMDSLYEELHPLFIFFTEKSDDSESRPLMEERLYEEVVNFIRSEYTHNGSKVTYVPMGKALRPITGHVHAGFEG